MKKSSKKCGTVFICHHILGKAKVSASFVFIDQQHLAICRLFLLFLKCATSAVNHSKK